MNASYLHTCLGVVSTLLITGIMLTHLYPTRLWFRDSADYFLPIISQQDQEDFIHLLRVFQKVVEANNISYVLISGSAIGAMRHHGMIPWDDDIGCAVLYLKAVRNGAVHHRPRLELCKNRSFYGMNASYLHTCLGVVSTLLITGIMLTHLYPTRLWFRDSADYFLPIISQQDQEDFIHLLRVFQKVVEANNISYVLISGSAIGAMRHHGMIPWDDDI
ncbi:uncharacterized protein DEA37_0008042, partial [Paragonimus westermani]